MRKKRWKKYGSMGSQVKLIKWKLEENKSLLKLVILLLAKRKFKKAKMKNKRKFTHRNAFQSLIKYLKKKLLLVHPSNQANLELYTSNIMTL